MRTAAHGAAVLLFYETISDCVRARRNGTAGSQLSNQLAADVITAHFATTTQTATMDISGNPGTTASKLTKRLYNPEPHDGSAKRLGG